MLSRSFFKIVFLLTVLLLLSVTVGCEPAEDPLEDLEEDLEEETAEEPAEKTEQILTIGVGRDFYYGSEDRTYLHGSTNVWEGLVYLDENLEPESWLAEDISLSQDEKTWIFQLREGVVFHDGAAFNAEAAKANIIRLRKHPQTADNYKYMEEVRATGTHTLEIELKKPLPAFPVLISYFPSAMFSPEVIETGGTELAAPVGTGPYKFADYSQDSIYLEANPDYWKGEPNIDQVVFHHIPDEGTRVAALRAGEVDALADVGIILPEQVPELEGIPEINLLTQEVLTSIYMFFQTENAPVDNPAVRRGISKLLDREELVNSLLDGYGEPARAVISPLAEYWIDDQESRYDYDPEEGSRLLDENLEENEKITILVNSSWAARWPLSSIAQYLQTELDKLGVESEIKSLEMGAYNEELGKGDFHVSFCPWTGQDPDDFFSSWLLSGSGFNQSRGVNFSSEEADELIQEAVQEMDREERRKIYFQLQDLAEEKAPLVPVYHDLTVYATRDYVKDFQMDFNFRPDLFPAYLE